MVDASELAKALLESIEARSKKFLDDHPEARERVADRAKRLAVLLAAYILADESSRPALDSSIREVRQTVENLLDGLALDASTEARAWFKDLVVTVFDIAVRLVPAAAKILARR